MLRSRSCLALMLLLFSSCAPEQPKPKSSDVVAGCRAALVEYERMGLIQAHPFPIRAEVDDALWRTLQQEQKAAALRVVACVAFEGEPLRGRDYVVFYGFDTGHRLAVLNSMGPNYQPIIFDKKGLPDFGS